MTELRSILRNARFLGLGLGKLLKHGGGTRPAATARPAARDGSAATERPAARNSSDEILARAASRAAKARSATKLRVQGRRLQFPGIGCGIGQRRDAGAGAGAAGGDWDKAFAVAGAVDSGRSIAAGAGIGAAADARQAARDGLKSGSAGRRTAAASTWDAARKRAMGAA